MEWNSICCRILSNSSMCPFSDLSTALRRERNLAVSWACYRRDCHGSRGGNRNRDGRHLRPPFNPNGYCIGCTERGHSIEDCPTKCNYCKEHGHLIDNCFKLKWVIELRFSSRDDNGEHGDGTMDMQYSSSFQRPSWMYIFFRGGLLVSMLQSLCRECLTSPFMVSIKDFSFLSGSLCI